MKETPMALWRVVFVAWICSVTVMVRADASAEEANAPVVELEMGGHLATINEIAFTPDGNFLVSASNDKTIRVWNPRTAETVNVIRGQYGPGTEGQIYAIAISPDSRSVVAGGWFGAAGAFQPCCGDLRRFDLLSGRMLGVFKGHTAPATSLAFSQNGEMLISASTNGEVYLWQVPPGEENGQAKEPIIVREPVVLDQGLSSVLKVAFLKGGNLAVAVSRNGEVIFYDVNRKVRVHEIVASDSQLVAATVGQKEAVVAVADRDGVVTTWRPGADSPDARIENVPYLAGSLTFYADDTKILTTCGFGCAGGGGQHVWLLSDPSKVSVYNGHDNAVRASAADPDGRYLATAGGERKEIHIWDPDHPDQARRLAGVGAPVWALDYEQDSRLISWGGDNPCPDVVYCPGASRALDYALKLPLPGEWLEDPLPVGSDGVRTVTPLTEQGQWQLRPQNGGAHDLPGAILQILDGQDVAFEVAKDPSDGWMHTAFSIRDGGDTFFAGDMRGEVAEYDLANGRLITRYSGGHNDSVLSIKEDSEENILLTGGNDERISIWNLQTGELIATLVYADERNWIIWVPQGYYYSSPDGDKLVGWRINQGADREARYMTARQLRRHLFSPEIVRRALELKSARQAVEELRPNDTRLAQLLAREAPSFKVETVENDPTVPEGYARVKVTWDRPGDVAEDELKIFANNRHIETVAARAIADGGADMEGVYDVKLQPGENRINIQASNQFGYVTERALRARFSRDERDKKKKRGRLFVVAVGVNDYPLLPKVCSGAGGSCNLKYAGKDASAFLEAVTETVGKRFAGGKQLILVNHGDLEPTADNIQDELERLLEEPTADDMTMVFFAGHGINIGEDYYFVPTDGEQRDAERWRTRSLIDWRFLRSVLESTKGTRLLFLDTCHSGNAYNARTVKETADAKIVVFSASKSNQYALEMSGKDHGLFTYSLVSGLNGAADLYKDQEIHLLELATYVSAEVNKLSSRRQTPEYYLSGLDDFLLTDW